MRNTIQENIVVGALVGALVLILSLFSLFVDARMAETEKIALTKSSASIVAERRGGSPDFPRIYAIQDTSDKSYGVVFSARSSMASGIFAAVYSPTGELKELRLIGTCSSRLPEDSRAALDSIVGSEEMLERARDAAAAMEADS